MYQEQLDEKTENGIEVEAERSAIRLNIIWLSNFFKDDADLNVVILDRTLAGEIL